MNLEVYTLTTADRANACNAHQGLAQTAVGASAPAEAREAVWAPSAANQAARAASLEERAASPEAMARLEASRTVFRVALADRDLREGRREEGEVAARWAGAAAVCVTWQGWR